MSRQQLRIDAIHAAVAAFLASLPCSYEEAAIACAVYAHVAERQLASADVLRLEAYSALRVGALAEADRLGEAHALFGVRS